MKSQVSGRFAELLPPHFEMCSTVAPSWRGRPPPRRRTCPARQTCGALASLHVTTRYRALAPAFDRSGHRRLCSVADVEDAGGADGGCEVVVVSSQAAALQERLSIACTVPGEADIQAGEEPHLPDLHVRRQRISWRTTPRQTSCWAGPALHVGIPD